MPMNRRLWRVMRGLGRSMGDSLRRPSREERQAREEVEQALAEQQARAEIEGLGVPPPEAPGGVPLPGSDRLGELPPPASGTQAPPTGFSLPQSYVPPADPALVPHYKTLELPLSASLEQIEHAYRRLKAQCDPSRTADPLQQARARQQEARLDEAYLSLRRALARERRL